MTHSPRVVSIIDQAAAILREGYNENGIDLHDDRIRVAILYTLHNLVAAQELGTGEFLGVGHAMIQLLDTYDKTVVPESLGSINIGEI